MSSWLRPVLAAGVLLSCASAFVVPAANAGREASQRRSPSSSVVAAAVEGLQGRQVNSEQEGSRGPLILGLALGLFMAVFSSQTPAALAVDAANGASVFAGNCAACHAGGNNAVQPDKKLKKEALETYGMYDVDRIKYQVTNGKNAMPAFGERLGPDDIEDVANYVITQANKGWVS